MIPLRVLALVDTNITGGNCLKDDAQGRLHWKLPRAQLMKFTNV